MNRITRFAFICILIVHNGNALAAPNAIGLGGFSGGATVINFNSIGNEQLINSQYSAQGVTFGGALYGMTNPGDTSQFPSNGGGVIASNWLYSQQSHQGTSFTATFANLQRRVGFYAETNSDDDTTIAVYVGANPQGAITFNTALNATFIGLQDPAGFNSVTVTVSGPFNNFLAVDDFRFEPVPEPSTIILLSCGALGFKPWRRRLTSRN